MAKTVKEKASSILNNEPPSGEAISVEEVVPETDEVIFLRKIMQIQDDGGWGKHLHSVINERINQLKGE